MIELVSEERKRAIYEERQDARRAAGLDPLSWYDWSCGFRAGMEALEIVHVDEVSLGELLMPFGGGDVQEGAILVRARHDPKARR